MKATTLLFATLIAAASGSAMAQYTGPSAGKSTLASAIKGKAPTVTPTTVKALMATGKDDAHVSLQGRIVRHLGGDDYRFADSSGEIDVEIDNEYWPANMPIDDKVEVRITGEYDKGLVCKPKVEVDRIEKVK